MVNNLSFIYNVCNFLACELMIVENSLSNYRKSFNTKMVVYKIYIRIDFKWVSIHSNWMEMREQLVSMLLLFNHDEALEMRYASSIRYVYYTIMNWIAFILDFQFQCMYKSLHWTWYHLKNNSNMIDIVWQSKWWAQTDIINTVESEWIDEKARLKIIHCMKHFYTI